MPFPFGEICTLFSRLEDTELHDPPILIAAKKSARIKETTESWFRSHRRQLNELDVDNAVALLSTLLPERRTDRVYGIQSTRLCRLLCRSLNLRSEHRKDLEAHRQPGRGDLASCLERVLKSGGGPPALPAVYLMEVDGMLDIMSANCRFSDTRYRLPPSSSEERDHLIGNLFKRLDPAQSKWLVRLILKDFSPIRINEALVLQSFHFLLPDLLRFQDDLRATISLLRGPLREYPDSPDPRSQKLHRQRAAELIEPVVGMKVGRPTFHKARSVENCMNMCGSQRWIVERKYDGEYCEIHVDMSRSPTASQCITIYSKSGKDSTHDRQDLLTTLVDCLHLGRPESKVKRRAILLGELVVYSTQDRRIQRFERVRRYVTRSGIFLGTGEDSRPHAHEHIAIVFFDLLLLDDDIVMRRPLEQRRMWLREVYTKIEGKAMGAEWKIVDFSEADHAKKTLIKQFAASIAARHEGLVLKPCDLPYFSLDLPTASAANGYIKVKKDYIAGMGDEADFAVIGGSYNGQQALKSDLPNLKWTGFHLGCLLNKADVLRFDTRPRFKVVGTIHFEHCIPSAILQAANSLGTFYAKPYNHTEQSGSFDVDHSHEISIETIFSEPLVFEVLGSGFEKPSNRSFFMLRHPRVKKLHQDRTWKDCVSMQELQEQAASARAAPIDSESQETRRFISRLEAKCKKKMRRQQTVTPTSTANTRSKVTTPASAHKPGNNSPLATAESKQPARRNSAFDGTTLVNTSNRSAKRPFEELEATPCPNAKRNKIEHPASKPCQSIECNRSRHIPSRSEAPLADITNTAPRLSSHPTASAGTGKVVKPTPAIRAPEERPSTLNSRRSAALSPLRHHASEQCSASSCLFANAVVFLTPCIAHTPYVAEDLLQNHNNIIILTLAHWDRDSSTHPPLADTVSESQAYAGMRKIVLVESNRTRAVESCVQQILALNKGKWRERAEVWDWRVLEERTSHDVVLDEAAMRRRYFLGATMFDETNDSAIFVENIF